MKNVLKGVLALAALAVPSAVFAAEPIKRACCALCSACGLGCC
jgi:hypothetical protein